MITKLKNSFAVLAMSAFIVLFAGASFASAALTQTQMEALMALGFSSSQITALEAMMGGSMTTNANCTAFGLPGVMGVQQAVNQLGYAPALMADGKFGMKTKAGVMWAQAKLGAGVDGAWGPMTNAKYTAWLANCSTTTTPTTTTPADSSLQGGAGDLSYSSTSTDVESSVKEGSEENVLGVKLEADGSDIKISSVKVMFEKTAGTGSTRLDRYVDDVMIMLDGKEVGSISADDFTKNGTEYSKSISLSNAIVRKGVSNKVNLHVAVATANTVDDVAADFTVTLEQVRWMDATGVVFSDNTTNNATFGFDDANADDDMSIKSSSNNPDATNLIVDVNQKSKEFLVGAFKLDVDDNSSDITVYELPVVLTINDSADTAASDSVDAIVDKVRVKIGSTWYNADLDNDTVTNGDGTATYLVSDEFGIDAGDAEEVKVYVTFTKQATHYGNGTTVVASVVGADIDAEGEDVLAVSGNFTGKTHNLVSTGAAASFISSSFQEENAGDSIDGTISVKFNLEAVNTDLVFAKIGTNFTKTLSGATATGYDVTCAGLTASGGNFTISDGDDRDCTLAAKFNTSTGFRILELTAVLGTTVQNIISSSY